jgi:hypothetical protein
MARPRNFLSFAYLRIVVNSYLIPVRSQKKAVVGGQKVMVRI